MQRIDPKTLINAEEIQYPKNKLNCSICGNIANKPIRCEHCDFYFCNICLIEYRKTNNPICPIETCGQKLALGVPTAEVQKIYNSLTFTCEREYCKKVYSFNEVESHRRNCYVKEIACVFKCETGGLMRGQLEHFQHAEICPNINLVCRKCNSRELRRNIANHNCAKNLIQKVTNKDDTTMKAAFDATIDYLVMMI